MPRAKKPTPEPSFDGQLAQSEDGTETPFADPQKTCIRCDHQVDEHDMNHVDPDDCKCRITSPVLMGDGSTQVLPCSCAAFRSIATQRIIDGPIEEWAHDPAHEAFARDFGLRFCICGQPGTKHFRGNACPPAYEGADVCTGFRLDEPSEEPEINVWPPEFHEGRLILERVIGFGGKLPMAHDSLEHVDLWGTLAVGKQIIVEVTLEVVGEGFVPVRSGGAKRAESQIIGLEAQRKLRVVDLAWPLAEDVLFDAEDLGGREPHMPTVAEVDATLSRSSPLAAALAIAQEPEA